MLAMVGPHRTSVENLSTSSDMTGSVDDAGYEPRLKYQRLGSSCSEILAREAATCMIVEDKLLALATQQGTVYIFDYNGNEVRKFQGHTAAVNDLSFDEKSEYIASCSDDGQVIVHGLYTDEVTKLKYSRPVKTVALDPCYSSRNDRQVACGGLAGQLMLNSRGWLGPRDVALHTGEGPISVLRWSSHLIAWANDKGVKVYDTQVHQRIGHIERERTPGHMEGYCCHLHWESDVLLYIGWGNSVQIARVAHHSQQGASSTYDQEDSSATQQGLISLPRTIMNKRQHPAGTPHRFVEILASFRTDYIVAGISPFGMNLAILAVRPGGSSNTEGLSNSNGLPLRTTEDNENSVVALRPELRIVSWQNQDIASDALSLNGFEHYTANDYCMAAFHPMRCRALDYQGSICRENPSASVEGVTKWWWDGYEPFYFVVSPKDIVQGRPRDTEDRINWMLARGHFEEALSLVESGESSGQLTRERVAQAYLDYLVNSSRYTEAASLCPRLLKGNAAAWERLVYVFAQARQLPALARHIPVNEPRLRTTAYEVVLSSLLASNTDHQELLRLIKIWPSTGLYSAKRICETAQARVEKYGGSPVLYEVLAELYKIQGEMDAALDVLLSLGRHDVFQFVLENQLLTALSEKIESFMAIDEEQTLSLLVEYSEDIPPQGVVQALQAAASNKNQPGAADHWRQQLHKYLHKLFSRDPDIGAEHHHLQVELYAEYDPKSLMNFLVQSEQYALEEALDICTTRGLVREMVFILGRMGNARKAVGLIIDELQDIPQAVKFVHDQRDDELWDVLISHATSSSSLTAALLQEIGSYCNPLRVLEQIPCGLSIPGLRDHLVKILSDFQTQTSLKKGCSGILRVDCIFLAKKLYKEVRRAAYVVHSVQRSPSANDAVAKPLKELWYLLQSPSPVLLVRPTMEQPWMNGGDKRRDDSTRSVGVFVGRKL